MTLFSYIIVHDNGFSPNPFFEYCTLACCKPLIRRKARVGDWIVGLTPKAQGNRVVYFMRVDEIKEFGPYWNDPRFRQKRTRHDKDFRLQCGDNIYEPLANGTFRQLRSLHSDGENEHCGNKELDLGGRNVLISETFAYFGSNAMALPPELKWLIAGRGHRCRFSDEQKTRFHEFASGSKLGIHALPRNWDKNDRSCNTRACRVR